MIYLKCGSLFLGRYNRVISIKTKSFRWLKYIPISFLHCPSSQPLINSSLFMSLWNVWDKLMVKISSRRISYSDSWWTSIAYNTAIAINFPVWPFTFTFPSWPDWEQSKNCRNNILKRTIRGFRCFDDFKYGYGLPVCSSQRNFKTDYEITETEIRKRIY